MKEKLHVKKIPKINLWCCKGKSEWYFGGKLDLSVLGITAEEALRNWYSEQYDLYKRECVRDTRKSWFERLFRK